MSSHYSDIRKLQLHLTQPKEDLRSSTFAAWLSTLPAVPIVFELGRNAAQGSAPISYGDIGTALGCLALYADSVMKAWKNVSAHSNRQLCKLDYLKLAQIAHIQWGAMQRFSRMFAESQDGAAREMISTSAIRQLKSFYINLMRMEATLRHLPPDETAFEWLLQSHLVRSYEAWSLQLGYHPSAPGPDGRGTTHGLHCHPFAPATELHRPHPDLVYHAEQIAQRRA